jgi:hypothetical protein
VAQGGGNIVAQGGGNIILNGGSNLKVLDPASAASAAGLLGINRASLISQDGNGLSSLAQAFFNPANVLSAVNPQQAIGSVGGYQLQSLPAPSAAAITVPAAWLAGQALNVTWRVTQTGSVCSLGVSLVLNGYRVGNPLLLTSGAAALPATLHPPTTPATIALMDLCTSKAISPGYSVRTK